nr:unnamed protein product [Spirometra erinaceieuropaei]
MVDSGVPQGSVLGPILFLIYVDDAARDLDCEVAMFVDDMKIWIVIRGPADEDRLQMNLNRLEEWSNRWLLRFNVAKCSILRLGNTARSASTRGYFLGGAALQEIEAQKDLGVLTTSSLKPSAHCSRVAKTAMSVLYAIKRKAPAAIPIIRPPTLTIPLSNLNAPLPLITATSIISATNTAATTNTATSATPVTDRNATDVPSTTNTFTITITNPTLSSDVESVPICLQCDGALPPHIGLVGHLRIHRAESGQPVSGAQTYGG